MDYTLRKIVVGFLLLIFTIKISYSQEKRVSLSFLETEIISILDKIEEQTGYYFLFNEKLIDTRQRVTINANNQSLDKLLDELFKNTNIKYSIIDNKIILSPDDMELTKKLYPISGVVSEENGNPLPGVNVKVEGTTTGTMTGNYGRYSINTGSRDAVLVFSFIGYENQSFPVAGKSIINVAMVPSVSNLEEVIVVGYGTIKKTDLTGAISAVSEDTYAPQPVTRIDDILQGRSAGVNVTAVSGAPGGTTSIRIRGANSITGNNEPLYVIDGFVGGSISDINPTDIESIQILKDASSTAIYGSRGANGVVLINTKKGSAGNPGFTLTTRYYRSNPIKLWPLLSAGEFAKVANDRADALGYARHFTNEEVAGFNENGGYDWQDLIYQSAGGKEVQLDYSGGSEAVTYFVSGNYLDQEGIIINSDFKRYSIRTNLDATISEKIRGSLKVNFARRESNNTSGSYNTSSVVAGATAWSPTTPPYNEYGQLTRYDPVCSIKTNPIELATNDAITESNTFNTISNINLRLLDGLTADIGLGMNYNNTQNKSFTQRLYTQTPSASRSSYESIFLQNTNMLTYSRTFNDIHSLTITNVVEFQYQKSDFFTAVASELFFPFLKYNNLNLAKTYSVSNGYAKSTIGSYIGRINYNLRDRYLITASLRTDRSSKFRRSNQTSVFPSVGIGWRVSEEKFMKSLHLINNLKLRASWGRTGSQAINVFGTVTQYNTSASSAGASWLNGTLTPGINIGDPGNENLKWETTTQSNIGVDLGFLRDRITIEADYFVKNTTDLLLREPLPGYAGGGYIYRNVGAVRNSGFEINLNTRIIERNNFSWKLNINLSSLKNKVTDLGNNPYIVMSGGAGAGMVTFPEMILKPGYNISSYYGFKSLGIWQVADAAEASLYGQQPGDYRYEDINKDHAFTGADLQIIGSGMPRNIIGMNNTIKYKGFTLNTFLQSMLGFEKWNFAYAQIMIAAADAREYTHRDILNRWSPDNPASRVAKFSKTSVPRVQSSEYVESGNYIRLKNISLQYQLPQNILKWGDLLVMISTQNLFTLTDYRGLDPETYSNIGSGDLKGGDGGAYPNAKTWTMGLTLNF